MTMPVGRRIPIWVKVAYSAYVIVVVPCYWVAYTPWNFLYFCDIALLVTAVAIWIESPLLVGMQAVAITVPQLLWVVDLLCRLVAGVHVTGPPLPQLKVTELEYPFTEVRIPLRVAVPVTPAVCGELLILIA